ncbi:MAG: AHH domain-containing protein, partial [Hyalangium sp.]|uniref:AHH domain-containing protein n=1 Tax=Hyalangium sp. TaxID=2028555 RepID=UPI003899EF69
EAMKGATTFEQIRDAGERFGRILGQESAKAVAMLLLAAIGQTAQGFAATVQTLPGSAEVAAQAEEQVGLSLPALGTVEEIALADEGVTVTVAANAVAMTARGTGGGKGPCVEKHHIATVCNDKDASRGGPWTPRFRKIFARAGMSLEDPANKMPLEGHYGPHPERYHQLVYKALTDATRTCRSVVECREGLTRALKALAKEIATPGTELNQLVTR